MANQKLNPTFLKAALSTWNATCETFLLDRDEKDDFKNLLAKLQNFDLILSTGAVSMGQFDFVADALKELNAKTYFHKAAIRPGKPILFAELENSGPIVFSLPGNPVSSVVGFRFFVETYLSTLFSKLPEKSMRAHLTHNYEKPKGLKCFFKAHLDLTESQARIEILEGQMSSMVSSLLKANAWVILPEDETQVAKGAEVQVFPLHFMSWSPQ